MSDNVADSNEGGSQNLNDWPAFPEGANLHSSGRYEYLRNSEPVDVQEDWQRYVLDDDSGRIYTQSSREVAAQQLKLSVRHLSASHCELRWQDAERDVCQRYYCAKASVAENPQWRLFPGLNEAGNENKSQSDSLQAEIFSPLMRVFAGDTLRAILANGGAAPVLLPDIRPSSDADSLLMPQLSQRTVALIGRQLLSIDGEDYGADVCSYSGDQYGTEAEDTTRFYIADDGLLLAYEWQANESETWQVRLSNYSRVSVK